MHAGEWVDDVYVWGSGYTSQNKAGIKQGPAMLCRRATVMSPLLSMQHDNKVFMSVTMLMIFCLFF